MKLHPLYETGPLGLTDDEIHKEQSELERAVIKKHPKLTISWRGSNGRVSHTAYTYLWTPEAIHRNMVLWAMSMANSIIIYGGSNWGMYYANYTSPDRNSPNGDPKFWRTEAQLEAKALTDKEMDAIFKAQKERLSRATIYQNVHTDYEGCSYNSVDWN